MCSFSDRDPIVPYDKRQLGNHFYLCQEWCLQEVCNFCVFVSSIKLHFEKRHTNSVVQYKLFKTQLAKQWSRLRGITYVKAGYIDPVESLRELKRRRRRQVKTWIDILPKRAQVKYSLAVLVEMEIRQFRRRRSRSSDYAHLTHSSFLFCRGRLWNIQRIACFRCIKI